MGQENNVCPCFARKAVGFLVRVRYVVPFIRGILTPVTSVTGVRMMPCRGRFHASVRCSSEMALYRNGPLSHGIPLCQRPKGGAKEALPRYIPISLTYKKASGPSLSRVGSFFLIRMLRRRFPGRRLVLRWTGRWALPSGGWWALPWAVSLPPSWEAWSPRRTGAWFRPKRPWR